MKNKIIETLMFQLLINYTVFVTFTFRIIIIIIIKDLLRECKVRFLSLFNCFCGSRNERRPRSCWEWKDKMKRRKRRSRIATSHLLGVGGASRPRPEVKAGRECQVREMNFKK